MRRALLTLAMVGAAVVALAVAPGSSDPSAMIAGSNRQGPPSSTPPPSTPGSGVACNVKEADVGYTAAFDHVDDRYEVTHAHVAVAPSLCAGATLRVDFTDGAGAVIGTGSAVIEGSPVAVPITLRPGAEFVYGVNVAIEAGREAPLRGAKR